MSSKSKIKIEHKTAPDKCTFSELDNGDWYDSGSCWGLCIKISAGAFYSVSAERVENCARQDWACRPVNVLIKHN